MTAPYYVHSDLFSYLTAFPELAKNANSADEISMITYKAMKADLNEISYGQLIVPTYNYQYSSTKVFDIINDVSEVGQFSELYRQDYKRYRSTVPIFSSCSELNTNTTDIVEAEIDPFGPDSDFDMLVNSGGNIITFGSAFAPTFLIFIEKQYPGGSIYRYEKIFSGTVLDNAGKKNQTKLINFVKPIQINFKYDLFKIEEELKDYGILENYILRDKFSYTICNAANFLEHMLNRLNSDPLYFLTKETTDLLHETGALKKGRILSENYEVQ